MLTPALNVASSLPSGTSGRTAVLFLHGFTGTPAVFTPLVEILRQKGHLVEAPLLSGHGTLPSDLENTDWNDWYASAEDAYLALASRSASVVIVGASCGASLACCLAAKYPAAGLVLIGTPRWLYRHALISLLVPLARRIGVRNYGKPAHRKAKAPHGQSGAPMLSYPYIPLKSVLDFLYLIEEVVPPLLPQVTAPVLMIQSAKDGVIRPESAHYVRSRLGSQEKELVWLHADHNHLHLGKSGERIYTMIDSFLQRYA